MCGAAVRAKRPASPIPASVAVTSKPSKVSRKAAEAKKKPPPQDPPPPTHPSGVVVEIIGTERGDQGRSCEEHEVNCGEVLAEDVVVRLCKVQILVEGREETAIAAMWINDGVDRCRVGFLPRHMLTHAARYDDTVAQVTRIFLGDPEASDTAECHAFDKNHGCCLAAIITWPSHHRDR